MGNEDPTSPGPPPAASPLHAPARPAFKPRYITKLPKPRAMQHLSSADAAAEAASAAATRADALRYNFISCLILAAQNGFGQDVDHLAALCRGARSSGGTR